MDSIAFVHGDGQVMIPRFSARGVPRMGPVAIHEAGKLFQRFAIGPDRWGMPVDGRA